MDEKTTEFLINKESSMVYCGNDEELFYEILGIYVEDSENLIKKLCTSLEQSDWKNYIINAHTLKSTSKTIGADRLSELAKTQEFAGKSESYEELKNNHDFMLEEFKKVLKEANNMLDKKVVGKNA